MISNKNERRIASENDARVGFMAYRKVTCYACKGEGYRWVIDDEDEDGNIIKYKEFCGRCDGTGEIEEYTDEDKY